MATNGNPQPPEPFWRTAGRAGGRFSLMFLIFAAAGTFAWPRGWLLMGLIVAMMAANVVLAKRRNPGLLRARLSRIRPTKPYDKLFVAVSSVLGLSMFIVAGLDFRFGWTSLPPGWVYPGIALHLAGCIPISWAMATNPYLETTVRIQSEKGHAVVSSGPYRLVRHPMYSGILVMYSSWPLILGTLSAYVPISLLLAAFVFRTALEDRTLRRELPGYEEYCRRTRYRLAPGLW